MPIVPIPYGEQTIHLQIPEGHWGELLFPAPTAAIHMEKGVRQAVENPDRGEPLFEFLAGCRSLLVIVNDRTRPTPTAWILKVLWPELSAFSAKFLVATKGAGFSRISGHGSKTG